MRMGLKSCAMSSGLTDLLCPIGMRCTTEPKLQRQGLTSKCPFPKRTIESLFPTLETELFPREKSMLAPKEF